ncbi:hypothetical protein BC938DRAFT_483710 [Jimgerdemannia flammicorona]|uniref:Uncharacterized protein n=1 Tax=Jimgerdemannia flammicorona TaxID=994334 RepID=A0A433QBE7_9FUNG|nr:hypothetical protein BC938DRAFT_483710 [Jimgerdemannia flammicorona]
MKCARVSSSKAPPCNVIVSSLITRHNVKVVIMHANNDQPFMHDLRRLPLNFVIADDEPHYPTQIMLWSRVLTGDILEHSSVC